MRSIPVRRLTATLASAAIVALAAGASVHAQTPGPAVSALGGIPLPPSPPAPPESASIDSAAPGAPSENVGPTGQRTLALRPFIRHTRGDDWVGLVREQDAVRTTFDVPNLSDIELVRLDLRLRNGADVLPTGSVLSVYVNGQQVGSIRPDAVSEPKVVSLALDPGLLVSRGNQLRIDADHAHRVSCTEVGSFELWSEIDPQTTGLALTYRNSVPVPALADLGTWLRSGAYRAREVPVLQPRATRPDAVAARAVNVARGLAVRGGGWLPAFKPAFLPADPGVLATTMPADALAVLVAPRPELARYLGPAVADLVAGPYIGLHRPNGFAGTDVLVISGRTPSEVTDAANRFAALRDHAAIPIEVAGDRPVTLTFTEMGLDARPFDGVAYDGEMVFRLASGAFPRQQQEAEFELTYRQTGPLGAGAEMVVWINGAVAATRALDDADSGRTVAANFSVALTRFRPGANRVRLAVRLPYPDGVACPDRTVTRATAARFTLDPSSTLRLPAMSRLFATPELHTTAVHAYPYASGPQPVSLVLPALRDGDLAAAMTLAGQLQRVSTTAIGIRIQPTLAQAAGGHGLLVATLDSLDPALLAAARIDRKILADLLRGTRNDIDNLRRQVSVDEWVGERVRRLRRNHLPTVAPEQPVAAVLQVVADEGDGAVWTAITADTPQQLSLAAELLAQPQRWESLDGVVALLGADGELVTALKPHRQRLTSAGEMTTATAALIAGGWLSDRVTWMIGAVLTLCLLAGGLLHGALRRTGRGHDAER